MRILFIHGRSQQGKDQDLLMQEWKDALVQSFRDANIDLPDFDFDFPYYGDDLIRLQETYQEQISSGVYKMKGKGTNSVKEFERELLFDLAENAAVDLGQAAEQFGPEVVEKGGENHKVPLYIIRYLDREWRKVGNYSISKWTKDVASYLIVPFIRETINEIVRSKLTKEPTIVIAHSLGSVVAYDILRALPTEDSNIKAIITLGSPLGVHAIKRQFDGKPERPESISGGWLNVRDELDLVALNPLNGVNFDVSPPIENINVDNQSDDHHDLSEYLRQTNVAEFIIEEMK